MQAELTLTASDFLRIAEQIKAESPDESGEQYGFDYYDGDFILCCQVLYTFDKLGYGEIVIDGKLFPTLFEAVNERYKITDPHAYCGDTEICVPYDLDKRLTEILNTK